MNIELLNQLHARSIVVGKCWIYIGTIHHGYGQIGINYKYYKVHRLAKSIFHKLDYKDKSWTANHIHSICKSKACWNPLHVYIGTQADNNKDIVKAGNHVGKNRTHCPDGHEYNQVNTRFYKGKRYCRICDRERKR